MTTGECGCGADLCSDCGQCPNCNGCSCDGPSEQQISDAIGRGGMR